MTPWLSVVGIGEDGLSGLSPVARHLVESAEMLVGGERHLAMIADDGRERHAWPTPLSALVDKIIAMRGRNVCVLATGDPMQFGIGTTLARNVAPEELTIVPGLSAFTLAAARLAWPLDRTTTLTAHGRPLEMLIPHLAPRARLLILAHDRQTPRQVAALLCDRGFGESPMVALAHMGGAGESRIAAKASDWAAEVPDFHTLAVECVAAPDASWQPRIGLPDDAFTHDGKLTKREIRAAALVKLMPHPGALLVDVGAGCGSIAVEWMRAAPHTRAVAIEPDAARRAMCAKNAAALGVPDLDLRDGRAPDALDGLEADAVFVGGGVSAATIAAAKSALSSGGRLVAHAVTLESEAVLLAAYAADGGELTRLAVARAAAVGPFSGWRPLMPVTQWAWRKL